MLQEIFTPVLVPLVGGKPADWDLFTDLESKFHPDHEFTGGTFVLVYEGIMERHGKVWNDELIWDDDLQWDE